MMTVRGKQLSEAEIINLDRCYAASDRQIALTRRQQALLAAAGESEPHRNWYVLRVAPNAEKDVEKFLDAKRIESWLPRRLMVQPRRGGRKGKPADAKEIIPWPGYLFVKVAPLPQAWAGLATVDGVVSVLGVGEHPFVVKDEEIERLKVDLGEAVERDRKAAEEREKAFSVGRTVLVTDGPFSSFRAVMVEEPKDGRARIEVMIFGRAALVDLDLAQLAES